MLREHCPGAGPEVWEAAGPPPVRSHPGSIGPDVPAPREALDSELLSPDSAGHRLPHLSVQGLLEPGAWVHSPMRDADQRPGPLAAQAALQDSQSPGTDPPRPSGNPQGYPAPHRDPDSLQEAGNKHRVLGRSGKPQNSGHGLLTASRAQSVGHPATAEGAERRGLDTKEGEGRRNE